MARTRLRKRLSFIIILLIICTLLPIRRVYSEEPGGVYFIATKTLELMAPLSVRSPYAVGNYELTREILHQVVTFNSALEKVIVDINRMSQQIPQDLDKQTLKQYIDKISALKIAYEQAPILPTGSFNEEVNDSIPEFRDALSRLQEARQLLMGTSNTDVLPLHIVAALQQLEYRMTTDWIVSQRNFDSCKNDDAERLKQNLLGLLSIYEGWISYHLRSDQNQLFTRISLKDEIISTTNEADRLGKAITSHNNMSVDVGKNIIHHDSREACYFMERGGLTKFRFIAPSYIEENPDWFKALELANKITENRYYSLTVEPHTILRAIYDKNVRDLEFKKTPWKNWATPTIQTFFKDQWAKGVAGEHVEKIKEYPLFPNSNQCAGMGREIENYMKDQNAILNDAKQWLRLRDKIISLSITEEVINKAYDVNKRLKKEAEAIRVADCEQ